MTKKSVKSEVSSFIKGLVTEASPLNFPPNASLSEENFELLRTGVRQRRLGMDYENDYAVNILPGPPFGVQGAINTFIWNNVSGINGKDFLVVQMGYALNFFNMQKDSLSRDGYVGRYDVGNLIEKYTFASIDGDLIVATGHPSLARVKYDISTGTFSAEYFSLKVRDLWGVSYAPTDSDPYYHPPQDAPAEHFYNLYNQSWGIPRRMDGEGPGKFFDVIGYYSTYYMRLPSSSEEVWTAMTMRPGEEPYEYIRTNAWGEMLGAAPSAAKGYFIIDALRRGPSRTQAIEDNKARFPQMYLSSFTAKQDTTPGGATVVYEFAGRVFYAGFSGEVLGGDIRSPRLSSYILYSQLVNSPNDLGKCYQEGDPTSREGNDIVDTDGGFIKISGASEIIGMSNIGSSLIVIGSNGTWVISGGSDYGFSATNNKVKQLSDVGCVSRSSIVKTSDSTLYWGANGIRSISITQTGDIIDTCISDNIINTFYSNISEKAKAVSAGVYDDVSKAVRWMYYEQDDQGVQSEIKELILDITVPAFYPYTVSNPPGCSIRGIFPTSTVQYRELYNNVVSGDDIVNSGLNVVTVPYLERMPSKSSVKYLMIQEAPLEFPKFTFGHYWNGKFKDWYSRDGVGIDAAAHLLTGAITAGDSSVDKQVPYVTVHMYRTENGVDSEMNPINVSGCLMRSQWEWSNSVNSKKWGPSQQVYRYRRGYLVDNSGDSYDTGFELITTKNKLRGQGRALSLHFSTEPEKDCRIVGWNINLNGNSVT